MNNKVLRGSLLLLAGAAIWGSAFVAQEMGMDYMGPFTFNAIRYFIGCLTLLPIIIFCDLRRKKLGDPDKKAEPAGWNIKAGIIAGAALFVPSCLQQIGLVETSAGKSGFITAMYIVTVPIFGLFLGKKAGINVWTAVALGVAGLYFLCVTDSFTIAPSDAVTLVSVVFWAIQILVIDHYASSTDSFKLCFMEFLTCGLLSMLLSLIFEHPTLEGIKGGIWCLLYVGVFSCGIAYTLQPIGQRDTPPAIAALMMSMESVFAALCGYIFLHDSFTDRERIGCALMIAAVLIAQFPAKIKKTKDV